MLGLARGPPGRWLRATVVHGPQVENRCPNLKQGMTNLVHESMSFTLCMHNLCKRIREFTITQLADEAARNSVLVTYVFNELHT